MNKNVKPSLFLNLNQFNRAAIFLLASFTLACSAARPPVPVGEIPAPKQVTIEEEQFGHELMGELTKKYQLDYNHPRGDKVLQIVETLTKTAKADKDPWHVFVFADPSVKNAAATRGNHVFIWTGMIDATKNDEELAAVLAHEIGHILARHTDPDPSEDVTNVLIAAGSMAAGIAAAIVTGDPNAARLASDVAQAITSEVGKGIFVYPYSRDRELEADQIGLFLMADAKFDPQASIDFWTRAQNDPGFSTSLAFLSTHPPAAERLENLKKMLPQAKDRFRGITQPPAPSAPAAPNTPATPQPQATPQPTPAATNQAPPSSDPPLSQGDSFDIRGENTKNTGAPAVDKKPENVPPAVQPKLPAPPDSAPDPKNTRRSSPLSYKVKEDGVTVYLLPAENSRKVIRILPDETVQVIDMFDGWAEISEPNKGFVRRDSLKKP